MKSSTSVLSISVLIIGGLCYGLLQFKNDSDALAKKVATKELEVLNMKRESANLLATYNARSGSAQPIDAFLLVWADEYRKVGTKLDQALRPLAEKHHLYLAEYASAPHRIKNDQYDLTCDRYTVRFLGKYEDVLRFIGDMEHDIGLAAVESLTLGRNLQDVVLQMQIVVPQLTFNSQNPNS